MPSAPSSTDTASILPAFDARAFVAALTEAPGVYRMLDRQGRVLYVGKAKNLKRRVGSYFQKNDQSPRIRLMLQQVANIEISVTRSEMEALILENTLIKKLAPRYNILFRDDKSYPYICLSGDEFPRLTFHRGAFDGRSRYFGPFPDGRAVRATLQLLQRSFRLRTCENAVFAHRSRPCLLHQIALCKAPCVGLVSREDYAADVRLAELMLRGRHSEVIENLSAQMQQEAAALRFEAAAVLRDRIRALQVVLQKQYVSSTGEENADVIGLTFEGGEVCVNLLMVRGGLHLGDRAFFPQLSASGAGEQGESPGEGSEIGEVLAAFLAQHYAEQPVPARIVLPCPSEEDWLLAFGEQQVACGLPRNELERGWLEMASKGAAVALASRRQLRQRRTDRLLALTEALALSELPSRIECFDISHTMGEGTVASCVVCLDGAMAKREYRRFNIENVTAGDDYGALRQALIRRYGKVASGEAPAPQLILIDGGKGQHAVAREVLAELGLEHLPSIGIAKGEERKAGCETLWPHLPGIASREPLQWSADDPAFLLVQEIRDEAHRFAVAGHRSRRAKARLGSRLDDIEGVGPARRRHLLAFFGGLSGVAEATIDDLCRAPGIHRQLAEKIYRYFH